MFLMLPGPAHRPNRPSKQQPPADPKLRRLAAFGSGSEAPGDGSLHVIPRSGRQRRGAGQTGQSGRRWQTT